MILTSLETGYRAILPWLHPPSDPQTGNIVDPIASAALTSWTLNAHVIALLLAIAAIYFRGWTRGRRLLRGERDHLRLSAFLAGLAMVFLATESPLDAFDNLYLSAHMAQHLLLMMVAPPLLLLGHPTLPLLRGLPRGFVKEGLGPFLSWRPLQRGLRTLVSPPLALAAFAVSTIFWHLPKFYELALRSPTWHGLQHACFFWTGIIFWWIVVQPGPGRSHWPRWIAIPHLLLADILNTALSAFFVFSGRLLYPAYEAVRGSTLTAQEDQTIAGLIMWVPGSIIYLVPAFVIVVRLLSGATITRQVAVVQRGGRVSPAFKKPFGILQIRRVAQPVMLLVAISIMADGFFGPQVTPLNLAGVLPWIHWRAFSVLALLIVGNLFCMSCPFTFVRDIGRTVLPANLRWPRWLRTKWLPAILLLIYLWAYEAFSLWDSPWLTAWIIASYFTAALVIDGLFRGASFCKYVCPIGQFHFVSSLVSPGQIRVRRREVCRSCRTHDCIRGNDRSRGCELYLFQPKKAGNLDCTFCLDCVKACPHDNVALLPIMPAQTLINDPYRSSLGRLSKRSDLAAMALLIVFGAFVNAAGMIGPVMTWQHRWHSRLGPHMMPLIVGVFVLAGAVVLPAAAVSICGAVNRLQRPAAAVFDIMRRFVFAFVPIGFAMWAAHLLYHLATGWNAAWPALERAFTGTIVPSAPAVIPGWLTSAQLLALDAGLLLTLYTSWRVALDYSARLRPALGLVAPWAVLSCGLYAAGVWILFQPMQMRGMLH
ncbi:MAG: cytochrome c oxidase assembly protein [Bryobacteraceae bacterium]